MNYEEYYQRLVNHDWFYHFSDDHRVWQAGEQNREQLIATSKKSEIAARMYRAFADHYSDVIEGKHTQRPIPTIEEVQQWLLEEKIAA